MDRRGFLGFLWKAAPAAGAAILAGSSGSGASAPGEFAPGQRVVCVDDANFRQPVHITPNRPRKGEVYVVRGTHRYGDGSSQQQLVFEALVNPVPPKAWAEPGFAARRFRAV